MRYAGILLAAALLVGASGLSHAQQTIKGKVATIDKAAGKISIQINGTSGRGMGMIAPTPLKVQDTHLLDAVKPGDQVTATTDNVNGEPTIKSLAKD